MSDLSQLRRVVPLKVWTLLCAHFYLKNITLTKWNFFGLKWDLCYILNAKRSATLFDSGFQKNNWIYFHKFSTTWKSSHWLFMIWHHYFEFQTESGIHNTVLHPTIVAAILERQTIRLCLKDVTVTGTKHRTSYKIRGKFAITRLHFFPKRLFNWYRQSEIPACY